MVTSKTTMEALSPADVRRVEENGIIRDGYGDTVGFQVTVQRVVDTVPLDGSGSLTYWEAALRVIGTEGDEGIYSFPDQDGQKVTVTITR